MVQLEKVTDAILSALDKLPLKNMVVDEGRLTIDVTEADKENPAIVDAIVGAGGKIQYVTRLSSTLEDAYLKFVRQEK